MVDSTTMRTHQNSAGAPKKADKGQAIGRSRGGLSTKIYTYVDALGNLLGFHLTAGEEHDLVGADHLLPDMLFADKRVIDRLQAAGKMAVIPPKANPSLTRSFDWHTYRARHRIENYCSRIKQFRTIATRHDESARNFLAAVHPVATVVWLN